MNEKEKDKRLIIPKDAFEEEASEGLGKLNREEASEDLRELKSRMERRVRKPRMIWLPAAAAVAVLLVASTVYIALVRDRRLPKTEIAMKEASITDTALIAMAQPITISEAKSTARAETPAAGVVPAERKNELMEADAVSGKAAENKDEIAAAPEAVQEAVAEEEVSAEVSEVVVVEALPGMEKAAAYEKMEKAAANDKKEKAPATRTMEDSAAATANLPAGTPDRQAAPIGGIEEFNQWIRKNIRYPEEVTPRVQQVVVVTFKISADSTMYDLEAERTPGELFTREAFRLLREGPRWEPAIRADKRVEEEVKISIVFK
jgi:hypothetical protein